MSSFAPSNRDVATLEPQPVSFRSRRTGSYRTRTLLTSVPLVLMSTIAMTLGLTAPANAAMPTKRVPKAKSTVPDTFMKSYAGVAVARLAPSEIAPSQYRVAEGDTISAIAARFGLSTTAVLAANGLDWSSVIFPGQVLTLAKHAQVPAAAPAPAASARYTVVSGDTISGIAAAHETSTAAVLSANGLDQSSIIYPGQSIVLPGSAPSAPTSAPAPPAPGTSAVSSHTIGSGDTISAIAAAAGVSVQAVLEANGLGWSSIIYPGQVLAVPAAATLAAVPAVAMTPITATPITAPPAAVPSAAESRVNTVLTEEMRQNAQTILSVGRAAGVNDTGLVIALAAAAQESGLRNVDYGDRDSLGLFQQRPSAGWGTPEQVMDPVRASLAFFGGGGNPNPGVTRGLLDVGGWESMTITQAAQAVQISAYPDHYAKWEAPARAWLAELG